MKKSNVSSFIKKKPQSIKLEPKQEDNQNNSTVIKDSIVKLEPNLNQNSNNNRNQINPLTSLLNAYDDSDNSNDEN